jgi:hypothetical protein
MRAFVSTVHLLLDAESAAAAADCLTGLLTENLSGYNPRSGLRDWAYAAEPMPADIPATHMPDDGLAWWALTVPPATGIPREANPPVPARVERLEKALRAIIGGSGVTGRWLDSDGTECGEDDPGATWHEYDEDKQRTWLEAVTRLAEEALLENGDFPEADGLEAATRLSRYQFPVTLSGVGTTPEAAWQDALDQFQADPGSPDASTIRREPME